MAVSVSIAITDDDSDPVDDVLVRIYDEADTFLAEGTTGSPNPAGHAVFLLDGDADGITYIVRLFKAGVTFPTTGPTFTILVLDPVSPPDTNTFDVDAHIASLPESLNPNLCKLSGTFLDVANRPVPGLSIEVKPKPSYPDTQERWTAHFLGVPLSVDGNVLTRSVKVQTNKSGFVELELPRGGKFEVHLYGLEDPLEITSFVTIPDEAGAALLDVLWPFVVSVTYGPDVIVSEHSTIDLSVEATLSNGQVISSIVALKEVLTFSSDDESVASVSLAKDGFLTISGTSAGSTTVEVARKSTVVAPRVPPVPALVVTPAAVTVTV
jgi:hypothetical protein